MFKVYLNDKVVYTAQKFITIFEKYKGSNINGYTIQDEEGYTYYLDGTGIGFRACKVLHSTIPFTFLPFKKDSCYDQKSKCFETILVNARTLLRDFGLKHSLDYLKRKRELINGKSKRN